jgi:non-ribosomal peptide synthetase component F
VFDILGCKSIGELVSRVIHRIKAAKALENVDSVQQPVHYNANELILRPISHSQSRLWFLQKFLADKTVYNLVLVCHISGTVDVDLFGKAWSIFTRRHEVLHSKLIDTTEGLQQFPIENPSFQLTQIEASEDEFQDQVERITKLARNHVFNLEAGELIRGWLLESPAGWRFFLASHHLAWDRASVPTIFEETTAIYKSLVSGEDAESTFPPAKYQFIDYTLWLEQQMARVELVAPHLDYWKAQLANVPEAVSLLPTAILPKRPVMKQYNVETLSIHLDSALTSSLKSFCRSTSATPFMFMTSAIGALVCRISGDDDIVIGIADGDRGHTEFDRLVGFTVNMLAIRNKINTSKPYLEVLEDYRKTCLEAYEHRAIPFDYLLQHLDVPRRTSHSPIFQITVNYQMQRSFPECDFGDFKFTNYDHYNAKSTSDFGIEIEETASGELDCVFQFDSSIYDKVAMQSFANMYQCFVSNIVKTKGLLSIKQLEVVTVEDQTFIASILQPSLESPKSLSDLDSDLFPVLFDKAVAANPQKAAIIDEEKATSWAELDSITNRVANYLLSQGLGIGDRVGICCEPSLDMIIGMYGIIKAGGVYVPLDPDFPEERMLSMIEDVELEHVLVGKVNGKIPEQLVSCGINSSSIHEIHTILSSYEDNNPPKISRPITKSDNFCCIFTSGTTGRPKGIYIGNSQLRYQMEGYHNCIETNSADRILLSSAMVFDMSLTAIFGTVLHGATMVIASREGNLILPNSQLNMRPH